MSFKKSFILLACVSAFYSVNSFAVDNNTSNAMLETNPPAPEGALSPDQTPPYEVQQPAQPSPVAASSEQVPADSPQQLLAMNDSPVDDQAIPQDEATGDLIADSMNPAQMPSGQPPQNAPSANGMPGNQMPPPSLPSTNTLPSNQMPQPSLPPTGMPQGQGQGPAIPQNMMPPSQAPMNQQGSMMPPSQQGSMMPPQGTTRNPISPGGTAAGQQSQMPQGTLPSPGTSVEPPARTPTVSNPAAVRSEAPNMTATSHIAPGGESSILTSPLAK